MVPLLRPLHIDEVRSGGVEVSTALVGVVRNGEDRNLGLDDIDLRPVMPTGRDSVSDYSALIPSFPSLCDEHVGRLC